MQVLFAELRRQRRNVWAVPGDRATQGQPGAGPKPRKEVPANARARPSAGKAERGRCAEKSATATARSPAKKREADAEARGKLCGRPTSGAAGRRRKLRRSDLPGAHCSDAGRLQHLRTARARPPWRRRAAQTAVLPGDSLCVRLAVGRGPDRPGRLLTPLRGPVNRTTI